MFVLVIVTIFYTSFFAVIFVSCCISAMAQNVTERGKCQKCGSRHTRVYTVLEVNMCNSVTLRWNEKRRRCGQCGHSQLLKRICSSERREKMLR